MNRHLTLRSLLAIEMRDEGPNESCRFSALCSHKDNTQFIFSIIKILENCALDSLFLLFLFFAIQVLHLDEIWHELETFARFTLLVLFDVVLFHYSRLTTLVWGEL